MKRQEDVGVVNTEVRLCSHLLLTLEPQVWGPYLPLDTTSKVEWMMSSASAVDLEQKLLDMEDGYRWSRGHPQRNGASNVTHVF